MLCRPDSSHVLRRVRARVHNVPVESHYTQSKEGRGGHGQHGHAEERLFHRRSGQVVRVYRRTSQSVLLPVPLRVRVHRVRLPGIGPTGEKKEEGRKAATIYYGRCWVKKGGG